MVVLYTPDKQKNDILQYEMDKRNIKYVIRESFGNDVFLVVHGVPLDYVRALKWVESRG